MASHFTFGSVLIPSHHAFVVRKNVFAFPSHRPFTPGHVLVASKRPVPTLKQLTQIETIDLWLTALQISKAMSERFQKEFSVTVQNGRDAGQTVPHVHIHVLPEGAKSQFDQGQLSDEKMGQIAADLKGLIQM